MLAAMIVAAASSLAAHTAPASAAATASADDTARFLAGMPPSDGSSLKTYTNEGFWKLHARVFDSTWDGLEKRQLSKIRTLVAKHFNDPKPTLFYTFSGPDFLYADAFFPTAETYVMAGLEPPGAIPNLNKFSKKELANALGELRGSLSSVLSYSFFRTKSMRIDFGKARMNGTVPVLMAFLARSGKTVYDVSLIDLDETGAVHPAEEKIANAKSKGVKIVFSDNTGKKRTLYYFSTDLSNDGIKTSGFLAFAGKLGSADAFIKSASYLMHEDKFSTIREFLLANSSSILEDDSGIPIRYFAQGWRLQPFGRYVGPIPLFRGQNQPALNRVFSKDRATPIDFGIGYRWRPMESNLLLAVKDSAANAPELSPENAAAEREKNRKSDRSAVEGKRVKEARADIPKREPRTPRKRKQQAAPVGSQMFLFEQP